MDGKYAKDFSEILSVLSENEELKSEVVELIKTKSIHGKATEEPQRKAIFREVLIDVVNGKLSTLESAYRATEERLSIIDSIYGWDRKVFASGWAERHVRTQLSRFYNQAVMERLIQDGKQECFIHHSSLEDSSTQCSIILAGKKHLVKELYERLIKNYENGNWDKEVKIPDHPHCTHVVSLHIN